MTDWLPGSQPAALPEGHPGFIYATDTCGCIVFSMVDEPREIKAAAKDIAKQVAKGREIHSAAFGHIQPWYCDEHRPAGWRD